ncbi:MAG: hypothetical protein COA62_13655 [Rhodobiaceae bacterium]|nr:MAG: hypothetical protein COA62_13655 [Rhodobiaceae bacterium]
MAVRDTFAGFTDRLRHRWMYRKGGKGLTIEWGRFLKAGALRRTALGLLAFFTLYYAVGAVWIHDIEDNADFQPPAAEFAPGGSHAVAMVAALIDREVDQKRWTSNDPWFVPSTLLDNMPNYQQGIISALARFSFELTDQLGRTRGSSQTDPDLQSASGLLQYAGDVWVWDPKVSLLPRASSEAQYSEARKALLNYNRRLAAGEAVFERRGDNLMATLDRIALDIGSSSASLDNAVVERSGNLFDFSADDQFYNVKGQLYAYYLLIKALGQDFDKLITERELNGAWEQMLDSLRKAAQLSPMVVVNGAPDGQLLPSHLAAQGFYLLRARTQLREITNILLK